MEASGFTGGIVAAVMPRSGRADAVEEFFNLGLQLQALARQILRGRKHPARSLAGPLAPCAALDVGGDVGRAARVRERLGDVCGAALLPTAAEIEGDIVDAFDGRVALCAHSSLIACAVW